MRVTISSFHASQAGSRTIRRSLAYNDVSADRAVVAAVQSLEAILSLAARGRPGGVVFVNEGRGGLVLYAPGLPEPQVLYVRRV
jgi:hypothetical protein